MVRFVVCNMVFYVLVLFDVLNNNIRILRFIVIDKYEVFFINVLELELIVSSLNYFINDNYVLYFREKRFIFDIVYEFKMLVFEFINLVEVVMKFLGEEWFEKDFKL